MENISVELLHDSTYFALLTTLSYESPITLLRSYSEKNEFDFSGKLLVDCILHSGNNEDRFIEICCKDGVLDFDTFTFVQVERKTDLRVRANNILRGYPCIIKNSILNSAQKKLLFSGISI